jgi:hypothetical protein
MTVSVSRISRPYWDAIPEAARERIAAAVPADCTLVVKPGHRAKPGTVDVGLRDARGFALGPEYRGRLTAGLCWAALDSVVLR